VGGKREKRIVEAGGVASHVGGVLLKKRAERTGF